MERFAADNLNAEREAHIKAALKANVPWTEVSEQYGLTLPEIEKMILDSMPGAQRKGTALIVPPSNRPKGTTPDKDDGW